MKFKAGWLALAVAMMLVAAYANATSFTYSGTLEDSGKPAEGSYDFQMTLYADAAGRKRLAGPVVLSKVPVKKGHFAVTLNFGDKGTMPSAAYVSEQIQVSGGKGGFSKPGLATLMPLATYLGSDLSLDPSGGLTDNIIIASTLQCLAYDKDGICLAAKCTADAVSNCALYAMSCTEGGHWYSGSSEEGTCSRII